MSDDSEDGYTILWAACIAFDSVHGVEGGVEVVQTVDVKPCPSEAGRGYQLHSEG